MISLSSVTFIYLACMTSCFSSEWLSSSWGREMSDSVVVIRWVSSTDLEHRGCSLWLIRHTNTHTHTCHPVLSLLYTAKTRWLFKPC